MTVHLVTNPAAAAGRGLRRVEAVLGHLGRGGATVEVHEPTGVSHARHLMAALVAGGAERVVVLGGDGLVHQAVNELAGSDTVLGIVAAGTGNDAVTGLGLATKLSAACQAALGSGRAVDLIEGPDGVAATVAIVGFAVAVNERAERLPFPRGGAKYTLATLAELPRLQTFELTMTVDGIDHDMSTNLLAVANLPYFGGGMKIAPEADPCDGLLDLVSIGPASRAMFAALLSTVFGGRHVSSRHVTNLRGSEVRLAGPDLAVRADGEPWGRLPLTLRARPAAIRIAGWKGH